jgi:hypothetical protein
MAEPNLDIIGGIACADVPESGPMPPMTSLFCWALVVMSSREPDLLRLQHLRHTGLFACDEFSIYSNVSAEVVPGVRTRQVDVDLQCTYGGEFGTALNTFIFLSVWNEVVREGKYRRAAWTVKVDADTVFIAGRLQDLLSAYSPAEAERGVYLNNCWRGLHGPIEVFSRTAVTALLAGYMQCWEHFNVLCAGPCKWGEDMFLDQCLDKVLHVKRENAYSLLIEDHCDPPPNWRGCQNRSVVSYHPFKTPEAYEACLSSAVPQVA